MSVERTAIALLLVSCAVTGSQDFPSYTSHPCIRECEEGAAPMVCEYDFTLEYYYVLTKACYDCPYNITDCFRPHCVTADGVNRALVTVNRMLPGPAIHVCRDDMVVVNVVNKMEGSDGVTIHWHGLFMLGYQYHDGASMITQCPISSQSHFQYKFKAANPGTHYWHAHTGLHRADGVYGAFVIREPRSRDHSSHLYQHDLPEHVLLVQDWMHSLTIDTFMSIMHAGYPFVAPSMIINGRGASAEFTHPVTNQTLHTPYSVFRVMKNETYRFRVISNGILKCPIQISVDDHQMVVVASDGGDFHPVVVSAVNVFPGERYDIILDADKDVGNYWIRARGLLDCASKKTSQVAVLRYETAPESEPSEPTDYDSGEREGKLLNPLNSKGSPEAMLVSWLNSTSPDPPDLKQVPDKQFYLALDFYPYDGYRYQHAVYYPVAAVRKKMYPPQINRISNTLPASPLLSQYDDIPQDQFCGPEHTYENCTAEFCECIHVLKVALNDTVELVVFDEGAGYRNHPMHLHGHNFRVVAMDKVNDTVTLTEIKELDAEGQILRNLDTPIAKDTVTVPDGGYTIIRFKADNPGFWLFHCHVAFHNLVGMGVVLEIGDRSSFPKPPRKFPTCGSWRYREEDEDQQNVEDDNKPCPTSAARTPYVPVVAWTLYVPVVLLFISFSSLSFFLL